MFNRWEDEYNDISIDNYIRILEMVMILVHVRYGCSFIWGCNVGNKYLMGDKICKNCMNKVQSIDV